MCFSINQSLYRRSLVMDDGSLYRSAGPGAGPGSRGLEGMDIGGDDYYYDTRNAVHVLASLIFSSHVHPPPASKVKPDPDEVTIQMSKGRHAVINGVLFYLCHYLRFRAVLVSFRSGDEGETESQPLRLSC